MPTLYVKIGNLRDNSGKLNNLGNKLRSIESRFTSIRHSLDYDVRRRDGIDNAMSNIDTQLDSICRGMQNLGGYLQNAAANYQKVEDRIKEKSNSLTKTVMFSISDISRGIARFIPSKVIKVLTSIGIFTKGSKLVTDTTGVKDFLKKSNVIVTNKRVFESIAGPVSKAAKVASDIAATNLAALIAKWEGIFKKPKINNVPTPSPAAQKPIVTDQAKFSRYLSYNPGVDDKDVRKLQQRLIELGYGPLDVDGKYGDKTTAAVNRFKDANKLGNTGDWKGVAGPDTWACIFGAGAISASQFVEMDKTDVTPSNMQGTGNSDWIPSTALDFNGSSDAAKYFRKYEKKFTKLHWDQEKINGLWQVSIEINKQYGIQIDPRFLLAIIIQEGTGSFNTSSTNRAADGEHGVETNFAVDLMKAESLIFGKILGYIEYGDEFRQVASTNSNKNGINGNGDIFQYCNWNTPIVRMNSKKVDNGVYASHGSWGEAVEKHYIELGGDASGYESYFSNIDKSVVENIAKTEGIKLPTFDFTPKENAKDSKGILVKGQWTISVK